MTAAIEAVEACLRVHDSDRVGEVIRRFHEILVTHLDREEELVIPVLLELKPHEAWALLHA
jgi:hemerythrin superfamily protein